MRLAVVAGVAQEVKAMVDFLVGEEVAVFALCDEGFDGEIEAVVFFEGEVAVGGLAAADEGADGGKGAVGLDVLGESFLRDAEGFGLTDGVQKGGLKLGFKCFIGHFCSSFVVGDFVSAEGRVVSL